MDVSDASGRPDPVKDYETISRELANFGSGLDSKPSIVVASKMDVVNKAKLAKLKRYCQRKKLELFPVSAVTGEGVDQLKWAMAERVEKPVAPGLREGLAGECLVCHPERRRRFAAGVGRSLRQWQNSCRRSAAPS